MEEPAEKTGCKALQPTGLPKICYVSFEMPRKIRKTLTQRQPRLCETFSTGFDAQEFSRQKFEQGYVVNAGMINPCTPRRAISSAVIHPWFREASE